MDRSCIVMICFDLPTTTAAQRRSYRRFRTFLLKRGYHPIQKSIYFKLLHYRGSLGSEIKAVKADSPKDGSIAVLPISKRDFSNMISVCGKEIDLSFYLDDFLVI